ncbi:MAG TPA: TIGR03118 family protein [Jatrophihabitans sp.]|nr:TIGR03118 family protein [Jatrophihabitans sp.]
MTAAPASGRDGGGNEHGEHATRFNQINVVSDLPGKAKLQDDSLKNAWGMSHGPNTPLWVSDNGTDVATLYTAGAGGAGAAKVAQFDIPGGAPTGQVFNDTSGFIVPGTTKPALFIFAGENGDLSAWNQAVSPNSSAVNVGHVADGVFKGLALVHSPFGPLLLVTDFHNNQIDIFDSHFQQLPGGNGVFSDPRLPADFAPFNVAEVGNHVVITYAKQMLPDRRDDQAGPGNGFVDVYTNYGAFVRRFEQHKVLNSPWGLLVAPSSFGSFAGDLLVGNFGDGRIHAFDLRDGDFEGTLRNTNGQRITIDGLWALIEGDGVAGGAGSVWFSAGPNNEADGLVGLLAPAR